jgi:hypothetical protein
MASVNGAPDGPLSDPVLARRERYRRAASQGQAAGYLLFAVAVILFVAGFALGFPGPLVTLTIVALVVGSLVLLPAIIVGYAVKAADREDLESQG